MAGTIKTQLQLGDSATATNNFTLTSAAADGSMKLSRGNAGATTQDILTIDATGKVAMPSTVIAGTGPTFSVFQSTAQTFSAFTKIQLTGVEWNLTGAFDATTNFRFQPTVAGYYQIEGAFTGGNSSASVYAYIYKNGAQYKSGAFSAATATNCSVVSAMVLLNGSTDYVELWGFQGVSQANTPGSSTTYFQAHLARSA